MCNRFRLSRDEAALAARFGFTGPFSEPRTLPAPELFPRKPAYVVREENGVRLLDVMDWGFPMSVRGASGKMIQKSVTNVRNYGSPFWKSALANPARRCLVPFDQFCEWEGETGAKIARWFGVPSQPVTSFAGVWRPTENGPVMAFLTTDPNPIVAPIHSKAMPVLLHESDEARWLECDFEEAIGLAVPFPSQLMSVE